MPSLKMNIPHNLTPDEARSRIRNLLAKLKEEQKDKISGLKEEWNGHTGSFQFTAMGYHLSGVIRVQSSEIDLDAKIPFAVSLFKGKIKQIIMDKASALLSE